MFCLNGLYFHDHFCEKTIVEVINILALFFEISKLKISWLTRSSRE